MHGLKVYITPEDVMDKMCTEVQELDETERGSSGFGHTGM